MGETDTTEPTGILSQNHTICGGVLRSVDAVCLGNRCRAIHSCGAAPRGRSTKTAGAYGNTNGLIYPVTALLL